MSKRRWVVLANPESNRVGFLQDALVRRGNEPAIVVPWIDFLQGEVSLTRVVQQGDFVRIESPGRDAAVEAALVGVGRTAEHGEIFFPRHWYDGFCRALQQVREQLSTAPSHRLLNDTEEIAIFFDKVATHARFQKAGLPVPDSLPAAKTLGELAIAMKEAAFRQVFVKLAHGSSASGAVAIRTDGNGRWCAYTTVEQTPERLYNSRRIRRLGDPDQIDSLLRALAPHGLHVEEWLPKATIGDQNFDIRALIIGGKLCHVVARMSQTPMTNLHLLNRRADVATVRKTVGESAWEALERLAEQAAVFFPKSLHIGLDVMWLPGYKRMYILEANAFGDLLPGTLCDGQTTYEAEVEAAEC